MGKTGHQMFANYSKNFTSTSKNIFSKKTLTVKVKETNLLNYIMYTNKWRNGQKRNYFLARKCIWQLQSFYLAHQAICNCWSGDQLSTTTKTLRFGEMMLAGTGKANFLPCLSTSSSL